jgi:ferric-dicitrate binding protein FerR (iron transport regulator)
MRSLALVCALLCTTGAWSQNAGKISRIVGTASLTRGAKTEPATVNEAVKWNDTVKTDAQGRARIVLSDGSILMVTSNAQLNIVNHDGESGKTQLELKYGYVRATVVGAALASAATPPFEIRTQTAVCGVLGTQFEIETDEQVTQAHVHEGSVHFTNSKTGEKMELQRGQTAHLVHRTGVMRQGLHPLFAARTRQRWQADREEMLAERQERNQRRQERAQAAARQKKGKAKKK